MTPRQQTVGNTGSSGNVVHLLITAGDRPTMAEDPERVMAEIWQRATQVGSVLEEILHESHGVLRWGINE